MSMPAPGGLGRATLIKRVTSDGLCEVQDHIQVGRVYRVDLASIREVQIFNTDRGREHTKTVITAIDERARVIGWFPVELLRIEES